MGTRRQEMIALLSSEPLTVRELSRRLGVPMSLVVEDLSHLQRSLGERLVVTPSRCQSCGHELSRESRFTAPSRCPRCRSERTSPPLISVRD